MVRTLLPRLLATAAVVTVLAVNVPAFLRTPLDCDPILFDLFARDAGAGRVLYRDMVENKPPGMFAAQLAVRHTLGWSVAALRAADLLVVTTGLVLLGRFAQPGRPTAGWLTAGLLLACYLSTSEWNHVQADVWCLLPLAVALYLRRGRLTGTGGLAGALAEGVVWGLGVWLKPHLVLVAAAVAVTSWRWAGGWRRATADALATVAGGLLCGAAGVGLMVAAGQWQPFAEHALGWVPEYAGADLYVAYGRWTCRLGVVVRLWPWALAYLLAVSVAVGLLVRRRSDPTSTLLAAALLAWFVQAWGLQHIFDYIHVGGLALSLALLARLAAGLPTPAARRMGWGALIGLAVLGHGPVFADRLGLWADCLRPSPAREPDPRLTRLNPMPRFNWPDLYRVTDFLAAQGCHDGEVGVLTDAALPVYTLTGLAPPTRYYIVQNNLLAFRSHRAEILADLASSPQRWAVVDLAGLRWHPPAGCDRRTPGDWPLPADWGPWADRVRFRAGRYLVLDLPAADVPAFLAAVSDYGAVP